ncbi:FBD-associated F-box protein [Trifolium repens]|nr:FBD-associated F-box protein [Trifolium repens]
MEKLEEDRLSSLPKIILHCILSKLPENDAVRTSVLSKAWLDTYYTFPILTFFTWNLLEKSLRQPIEYSERMRKILGFCDYVKRRILRFRDQSLTIKEFELILDSFRICNISNDVDIWLKLACECGVEVIKYSLMAPIGDYECGVEVIKYSQTVLVHGIRYHVFPISTLPTPTHIIITLYLSLKFLF